MSRKPPIRLRGPNQADRATRQLYEDVDRALRQLTDRLCELEDCCERAAGTVTQLFVSESSGDSGAQLQAAINRLVASTVAGTCGATLILRPGRYRISAPVSIPSGVTIYGQGACIVMPSGANFTAFDLDGVTDVTLDDIQFECEGSPGGTCYGVQVRGDSARVQVTRCRASALGSGFVVRGENGSTPGTATDIKFADCDSDGNLQSYGFQASGCDGVVWHGCQANRNALDGFKLRVLTANCKLLDCTARENGWPSGFGDGLDAYGGGDSFVVDNFTTIDNVGNGMTIKTDIDTRDSPGTFGYVRRIQISNCVVKGNFYGIFLATNTGSVNSYDDDGGATYPQPKHATIMNCEVAENAFQGLYINMVGVTVHGGIYRSNGYDGIQIGLRSLFVDVYSPMLVANGTDAADGGYNMYVRGKYCRIHSPQFYGVDPDIVREETDYTGSMVPIANLAVGSSATVDNIEVIDPWEDPTSEGTITTANTTADIRFHLHGAGTPEGNYRGGVGSTYKQTDATEGRDAFWMKVSGTPATATGWAPFTPGNIGDANSGFGDWAFGALDEAVSGVSILNAGTGLGGVAFVSSAGGLQGALEYSHDVSTMYFRVGASQVFRVNAAAILPQNHEGLLVGSDSVRFSRVNAQSYAGNFQDSPTGLGLSWYAIMGNGESTALPAASGRTGVTYLVEHSGAGADVTIGRAGGDTINGAAANFSLGAGQLAVCVSDGASDWRVSIIGLASTGPGGTDHGALTGLGDDDHPQYLLADGTRDVVGPLTMDLASGGDYINLAEDSSAFPAAGDHRIGRPGTGSSVWAWYDGSLWLNALQVTNAGVTRVTDLVAVDSAELAGLTYPTVDGSADHVMVTDGAGNLSLTSVASVLPNGLDQVGTFGGETLYWDTGTGSWRAGLQLRHGDSPSGRVEIDRTLVIEGGAPGGNTQALEFRDYSSAVADGDHRLARNFLDRLLFQVRSGGAWTDWLITDDSGEPEFQTAVSMLSTLGVDGDVAVGGVMNVGAQTPSSMPGTAPNLQVGDALSQWNGIHIVTGDGVAADDRAVISMGSPADIDAYEMRFRVRAGYVNHVLSGVSRYVFSTTTIRPFSDGGMDLGATSHYWNNGYIRNMFLDGVQQGSVPIGTGDGNTLRWETSTGVWEESSALVIADSGDVTIAGALAVGGAAVSDVSDANSDDLIVGAPAAAQAGQTIRSTSDGWTNYSDNGGLVGAHRYQHASDRMHTYTAGVLRTFLDANEYSPHADNSLDLGRASLRWARGFFAGNVAVGGSLDVGGFSAGTKLITIGKADADNGVLRFLNVDATESDGDYRLIHDTTEGWRIQRFDGSWLDSLTIAPSTGRLSVRNADQFQVLTTNGVYVQNAADNQRVRVGLSTQIGARLDLLKADAGAAYQDWYTDVLRWREEFAVSEQLLYRRYDALGVYQAEWMQVTASGLVSIGNDRAWEIQTGGLLYPRTSGSYGIGNTSNRVQQITLSSYVRIGERSSVGGTAGYGDLWVRNDDPCTIMANDDDGNARPISLMNEVQFPLAGLGRYDTGDTFVTYAAGTPTTDEVVEFNIDADCTATWNFTMPHNYAGQDVAMRVTYFISATDGAVGGGRNFDLSFEFDRIEDGRALATVSYDTPTTANQVPAALDTQYTALVTIPAANLDGAVAGDHVRLRFGVTAETPSVVKVSLTRLALVDNVAA